MIYSLLCGFFLLVRSHAALPGLPDDGEVVAVKEVNSANPKQITTFFIPIDEKTQANAQTDFGITAGDVAEAIEAIDASSDDKTVQVEQLLLGSSSDDDAVVIFDVVSGEIVDCTNTLILSESILNIPPYYYEADPVIVEECRKAKAEADVVVFGAEQATSVVDVRQFITTDGIDPVVRQSLFLNTRSKLLATSTATLRNFAEDGSDSTVSVDSSATAAGDDAETTQQFDSSIEGGKVTLTGKSIAKSNSSKGSTKPVVQVVEEEPLEPPPTKKQPPAPVFVVKEEQPTTKQSPAHKKDVEMKPVVVVAEKPTKQQATKNKKPKKSKKSRRPKRNRPIKKFIRRTKKARQQNKNKRNKRRGLL